MRRKNAKKTREQKKKKEKNVTNLKERGETILTKRAGKHGPELPCSEMLLKCCGWTDLQKDRRTDRELSNDARTPLKRWNKN